MVWNSRSDSEAKEELIKLLKPCVSEGDYTLSSGIKTKVYIDVKPVILSQEGAHLVASMILPKIPDNVEAIGGVVVGACPIVSTCVALSQKPLNGFYIRKKEKDHGKKKRIIGDLARHVVLVEDVITTGKTLVEAVQLVRESGCIVEMVYAIVNREMGADIAMTKAGIQLESFLLAKDIY